MPVWELEPGCERPIPRRETMGKAPTITMDEILDRCRRLGARIEMGSRRHAVYPADESRPIVWIPIRAADQSRDLTEVVRRLRKSGIDIENMPQKETSVNRPTPADVAPRLNGHPVSPKLQPAVEDSTALKEQIETLFGMLAEAERRVSDLRETLGGAEDRIDELDKRLQAESECRKFDLEQVAILARRVGRVEAALARVPGAPDPNAELDAAILAFLASVPVKVTAQVVAANIAIETESHQVGKRLQSLAHAGKVELVQEVAGGVRWYRTLGQAG